MPVPAATVRVSPWEMVWFEPEVPARVKSVAPEDTVVAAQEIPEIQMLPEATSGKVKV